MGVKKIFQGATFEDTLALRLQDSCNKDLVSPFAIEVGSVVEVRFPGVSGTVVLSTANSGEITLVDSALATISYVGSPTKSNQLKIGSNQSIDVVVTQGISGKIVAFEIAKYADVSALAAP